MRDEKENERVQTRPGKIKEKNLKKKEKRQGFQLKKWREDF